MNTKMVLLLAVGALGLVGASLLIDSGPKRPEPPPPPMLAGAPATSPDFASAAPPPPRPAPPPPAAAAAGRLVAAPTSLRVETMAGGVARGAVRLSNAGGQRLTVTAALSGDGAFALEGNGCPEALDPAQTCLIPLVFRPERDGTVAADLLLQPATGDPITVPLSGVATAPASPPPPSAPPPPDNRARDALRRQRLAGLPQGVGAPPRDGNRATLEAYEAQARSYQTVNTVPEAGISQPDYGGYSNYSSSLPVDSCRVVGADSVIEATLQSYIDSSQCGEVRATVSRHVYNSGGNGSCRNVLIPAGSTIIGECTAVGGSQERVDIRWRRIIRAGDRAHILIEEAASDLLGRKGLPGYIDRGTERALLATVLGAAVNAATGGLVGALDRSTITSAIDITTGLATSTQQNRSAAGTAASAFAHSVAEGVAPLVERELERLRAQSQVIVPPGTRITIIPTTDLWIRSPGQGPLVMGETGRAGAGPGLGDRLNPQFRPAGAGGQSVGGPTSVGSQPSYYGSAQGGPAVRNGVGLYETMRQGAATPGFLQQGGSSLLPGQNTSLYGGAPTSVQRVLPGRAWSGAPY